MNDLGQKARDLIDSFRPCEALELLDSATPYLIPWTRASMLRARALLGLEQFRDARNLLGNALKAGRPALDEVEARLLEVRALRRSSPFVDQALENFGSRAACRVLARSPAETLSTWCPHRSATTAMPFSGSPR